MQLRGHRPRMSKQRIPPESATPAELSKRGYQSGLLNMAFATMRNESSG